VPVTGGAGSSPAFCPKLSLLGEGFFRFGTFVALYYQNWIMR